MTDWKFIFYLHFIQLQTSNFQFLQVLVKMRRIAVFVVVVILFRCHASDKFQEAIFWSITWIFLLHCLSLKYAVSHNFRWSNVPFHQYKLKMSSFWSNSPMAPWFKTRFPRLVHLRVSFWKQCLLHLIEKWFLSFGFL